MVEHFGCPRSITLPSLYTGLSASGNTGKIGNYEELRRLAFLNWKRYPGFNSKQ